MKTTEKKGIAILWMVVFAAASFFSFALKPSKTTVPPVSFIKEIREDAANIQFNQQKMENLVNQCVIERTDRNDAGVLAIKTELAKTKAEIKKDKKHMKASKEALKESHESIIGATKKQVRENKADYRELRRKIDKDVGDRNESVWAGDVFQLSQKQKELSKSEAMLERQKAAKKADLTTAKKVMQDADAEFRVLESTFQRIENVFASNKCY